MAGFRHAGVEGGAGRPVQPIDSGTNALVATPAPSVIDAALPAVPLLAFGAPGLAAGVGYTMLRMYYADNLAALSAVHTRALALAPAAIAEATGFNDLGKLVSALLSGLLIALIALGASTALGAVIGGVIGFFFGVAGAAPGAVAGAQVGFDVGMAILTWVGVGFLVKSIGEGLGELTNSVVSAIRHGWHAGDNANRVTRSAQIEQAASELARAIGLLFRLILEGIVAYLTRGAPMAATRGAAATVGQLRSAGSEAVAAETVAELVGKLRGKDCKLGNDFADWVEVNWKKLVEDPRFRRPRPKASASGTSAGAEAETPSQVRGGSEQPESPQRSIKDESNAKKGVFGEAKADEYMANSGYEKLNGNLTQIGDAPKGTGIDGVWKNSSPPPEYVISEAKYGSSQLGTLKDGTRQMSDKWVDDRLNSAVGRRMADDIRDATDRGQVEKWLLRVDDTGSVTKSVLPAGK